ncbi:MAG: 16S rRNA (cytosine(967)-C(5))-methyltransferase RsmB [Defluviitaleaceae bacterium]|nr:16S rRNA (cytosine(967)-C(5))-methyltransferase RsmB [Defluviitaleaceae bacterium]
MNDREVSIKILIDILENGSYNNISLRHNLLKHRNLNALSKATITDIVNGVLRNIIHIDYIINKFSKTKTTKMDNLILYTMRSAVYEIFYTNTEHYAIVNEAVDIVKKKYKNLAPFMNGVLRNIIRNKNNIIYPSEKLEKISLIYSTSMWIVEYLSTFLNDSELISICSSSLVPPKISICINTILTTKEDLVKILKDENVEVIEEDDNIYIYKTKNIAELNSFKNGLFHIMDENSINAIKELSPNPNSIVYDLCAAPGGKSFYMAYLMKNKGKIYSTDIHKHKIDILKENAKRLKISIINANICDISNPDTQDFKLKENFADYVLLDAPCSGFGTLQKKPDIKYTKKIEDIYNLADLQKKLLNSASKYVKIGGRILYSTCTISIEENQNNIKWFTNNFKYKLLKEKQYIPNGYNGDGFYTALLERY